MPNTSRHCRRALKASYPAWKAANLGSDRVIALRITISHASERQNAIRGGRRARELYPALLLPAFRMRYR